MSTPRILVVGMGDTGVLTASHLARRYQVVGVATTPGLLSGQELGMRLARPQRWSTDYWVPFESYRRLRGVRIVSGQAVSVDLDDRSVEVRASDGSSTRETCDVLVIATGVRNGFWRTQTIRSAAEVDAALAAAHQAVADADRVMVLGGGASAVGAAANIAGQWPDKHVDLYHPGERPLRHHHARVWQTLSARLGQLGVHVHAGYRARIAAEADRPGLDTSGRPVQWETGQPAETADVVLWTIGAVTPNSEWLPRGLLTDDGFVRVDPDLTIPGHPWMFAVGDIAATDPLRSSARNRADRLVARNIRAYLDGGSSGSFRPRSTRWGSVIGPQPDGLQVFAPDGRAYRIPARVVDAVLMPWIVGRGIYGGIRRRRVGR